MTAPTPEKIQRYDFGESGFKREADDGEFVFYDDLLRHLKLAQIRAYNNAIGLMDATLPWRADAVARIKLEIDALRKEIEG